MAFCWLVLATAAAHAQGRDPAAAETLFQEGRDAMQRGDHSVACAKFRESQRLDPGVGTLMNWADCEEKLGHIASAWERWHEAMDLAHDGDRIAYARHRAALLDSRVPRLAITLSGASRERARVVRDDVELGSVSLGSPLPVEPGAHVIRVIADGHADRKMIVYVSEGQRTTIDVSPGVPLAGRNGPTAQTPMDNLVSARFDGRAGRSWGWALLGAGVAGVVGGAVTSTLIAHDAKVVGSHCDSDRTCDTTGYHAAQSGKNLLIPNIALFAVGAAGLGVGGYLLLSNKTPVKTAIGAQLLPSGAVVSWEGRL
jgi:hypothetical protein